MRSAWVGKLLLVLVVIGVLQAVLWRIGFLVDERRGRQVEAVQSVQQSLASSQTVAGPLLQRRCTEEWTQSVGTGQDRHDEPARRDFVLVATAQDLVVDGVTQSDTRHRGLFKVNGYNAQLSLEAHWASLDALRPRREVKGSRLQCQPVTVVVAISDVRGVREAQLQINGAPVAVRPGSQHAVYKSGLHALLDEALVPVAPGPLDAHENSKADERAPATAALALKLKLGLAGTAGLAVVPAAEQSQWRLRSDWPHPSFGGRFLPTTREITPQGFTAQWSLSALATSAPEGMRQGAPLCLPDLARTYGGPESVVSGGPANCLDTLGVAFFDPINPYMLTDRAIKYGLLFIVLTFVAVGLAELLARDRVRRVHPVQYAMVGLALSLFFLLLLSLSEHLAFDTAYLVASAASVLLLALYAGHMLGRWRDGLGFGSALAGLYGMLWVLLQREQTALVIGSVALFVALATVMLLTRRLDWYSLGDQLQRSIAPARAAQAVAADAPMEPKDTNV